VQPKVKARAAHPREPAGPGPVNINDLNGRERWQGRQGSNLRQPVLETGTLPTELHPCRDHASPPIRAVSSIGNASIARAKRLTNADPAATHRLTTSAKLRQQIGQALPANALFKPQVLRQT
jgi:hypothetical protein